MNVRAIAWTLIILSSSVFAETQFAPEPASGPPTISAAYPDDAKPPAVIGKLTVTGTGAVTLLANRSQGRLVIKAMDESGTLVGRAETIMGIGDTSLYIRSSRGLFKIMVHWKT
jgi:hypothetical protein